MAHNVDIYDIKILEILGKDSRITVGKLSACVGISIRACQIRQRRLIADGYIERFRAVLNPEKFGLSHLTFAEVKLSQTHVSAIKAFEKAALSIPEIEECHMVAGRFDYLLKVRTSDMRHYRDVLGEKISSLPFVERTSTNVVMEAIKEG